MMSATDVHIDSEQADFIPLGRFEPPDAKRILRRLEKQGIPFRVDAPGEVRPIPTAHRKRHFLIIYVHPDDIDRAGEIVSADFRI
jgi:hypothetical protein